MTTESPEPTLLNGFTYCERLFVEVTENGALFYEAEFKSTTYNQSREGIVGLNQTFVDMLNAQAEIGRQAAAQHRGKTGDPVASASAADTGGARRA